MGLKFFRSNDKSKKIGKRLNLSQSWFRTLKWVSCKYKSQNNTMNWLLISLLPYRSRTSRGCCRSWLQGRTYGFPRSPPTSRHEEIRHL